MHRGDVVFNIFLTILRRIDGIRTFINIILTVTVQLYYKTVTPIIDYIFLCDKTAITVPLPFCTQSLYACIFLQYYTNLVMYL